MAMNEQQEHKEYKKTDAVDKIGRFLVLVAGCMAIGAAGIGLWEYLTTLKEGRYVVTDKWNNNIEYYSISNPAERHIMHFDADATWYPYISVGDTIRGRSKFMNEPLSHSKYYDIVGVGSTICDVNGYDENTLPKIVARDSIIRQMKQRQK